MKILKVEFQNINSLAGRWTIHFDQGEIASEGLFLIHGDTGAGKTTILDAICLGLYGRTRRVEPTGKNGNLISRGATLSTSSVTFLGNDGRSYLSSWSQRRKNPTKKNPEGSIEKPKQEPLMVLDGDFMAAANQSVEEVIGLNFDQFTKTVILPQGEFAEFMKGNNARSMDLRAEILEKLTGTEIFCRIGMSVSAKATKMKEILGKSEAELGVLSEKSMAPEKRLELKAKSTSLESEILIKREAQSVWQKALDWFAQLKILEAKSDQFQKSLKEAQSARETFNGSVLALDRDESARLVKPFEEALVAAKKWANDIQSEIDKAIKARLQVQAEKSEADQAVVDRAKALLAAQKGEAQRCLQAVENQAGQLASLREVGLKAANEVVAKKEESLEALVASETSAKSAFESFSEGQNFEEILEKSRDHYRHIDALRRQLSELNQSSEAFCLAANREAQEVAKKRSQAQTLAIDEAQAQEKIQSAVSSKLRTQSQLESAKQALKKAQMASLAADDDVASARTKKASIQALLALYPSLLASGECPLCGVHHGEKELKQIAERFHALDGAKAVEEALAAKERATEALKKSAADVSALEKTLSDENLAFELARNALAEASSRRARAEEVAKGAQEASESARRVRQRELDDKKTVFLAAGRDVGVDLSDEKSWSDTLASAHLAALNLGKSAKANVDSLRSLKGAWDAAKDRCRVAEREVFEARAHLNQVKGQISDGEAKLSLAKERAEGALKAAKNGEIAFVENIGTNHSPDLVKPAFNTSVNQAEDDLKTAFLKRQKVQQIEGEILAKVETLTGQLPTAQSSVLQREEALNLQVIQRGFLNVDEAMLAILSDEKRHSMTLQKEALDLRLMEAQSRYQQSESDLKSHKIRCETSLPKGCESERTASKKVSALREEIQDLSEQRGGILRELALDDEIKVMLGNRERQLENLRRESDRWCVLDGLIGNRDGMKFKRYAQGLTLQHLIERANEILPAMTQGRYELMRDEQSELSFCVIDHDMNDVCRATANLSGGETFIVSLALALGLTKITAKGIHFDSLFLDEGFGTLDGKALAEVMGVLQLLRDRGKTIGIISHVLSLTETGMPTIEAKKRGNGLSFLVGAGVKMG